MEHIVYFQDNFFSTGNTDIKDGDNNRVGSLDLKSAFSSSVSIMDEENLEMMRGFFPFFSNTWQVEDYQNEQLGSLKHAWFSFSKKFHYETNNRGVYEITSPVFSREYYVKDHQGQEIATFTRVDSFFSAPAFKLVNKSAELSSEELVVVIMGVNAIEKRRRSNNSNAGAH